MKDAAFYKRLAGGGSLALGESYMDGWWECQALDRFFERILTARIGQRPVHSIKSAWLGLKAYFMASPGKRRAFEIGKRHYDIGNELFRAMLDKWMNYSCGYWQDTGDLDTAQKAKMDLICRKLKLEPDMEVVTRCLKSGGLFLLHTPLRPVRGNSQPL